MYCTLEAVAVDGVATISVAELGQRCAGAAPQTVRRCLAKLQRLGVLTVHEQTGAATGGRLPNLYRLPLARPREHAVETTDRPQPAPAPRPRTRVPPVKEPTPTPAPPAFGELFPELLAGAPALQKGRPRTSKKYVATCPGFEEFYQAWPRKVARQEAEKAWDQTVEVRPALAEIVAAATRYAAEVRGRDPEKILHPATWLRAHRWNDEIPVRNGASRGSRGGGYRPAPDGMDDSRRAALAAAGQTHEED